MKVSRKIAVFGSLALGISGLLVGLRTYEKYAAERKKLSNIANEIRVKADQGDAAAQYKLARFYYQGKGVSKDYSEAFRWYRKAADKGYAKADFNLGEMYYRGEGVPKDLAVALSWTQKGADLADPYSEAVLGYTYLHGEGVPRND